MKPVGGDKEEGEISSPQEQSSARASEEFQKALLDTQAPGTEVILPRDEEELRVQLEQKVIEYQAEGEDAAMMEMEMIKATFLENGIDMDGDDILNELTDEEAERELMAMDTDTKMLKEENNEVQVEVKGKDGKEMVKKAGAKKKLFKGNISTAGSTKMRNACALVCPRKKTGTKMTTRLGETSKQGENKGNNFLCLWIKRKIIKAGRECLYFSGFYW